MDMTDREVDFLDISLPAEFDVRWFSPQQRNIITALCSITNPVGGAIGSLLPSLVVTDGLTNRHYLILLFHFVLGLAMANSITTVLYQLNQPSEYSSEAAGIFGATLIVTGIVSSCIAGVIMDRTKREKMISLISPGF
ncbi:unnamed protein product [Rotaria magnacalcarata]|uniref:Major facilitator superfamily (MFS) profile domain-containing protein n=2 Tax=Rotaria magnacalcarata TaxID=392030 RepID=A0A816LLJ0_9BILA|nr:unnamed protein product [Rotaria magnacalcarata]CAF1943526.1 unnamed protein product [Rotaria magnacalcarata]